VIIAGDIHGQIRLMEKIIKSFGEAILFTGDIIDRGDSKNCLELLLSSRAKSIMGNHEAMAIAFSESPKHLLKNYYFIWMANGGIQTLNSLYISGYSISDTQKAINANPYIDKIKKFPIYKIYNHIMVIHAGIDKGYLTDRQESFLWSRTSIDKVEHSAISSFRNDYPNIELIVTGHNIVKNPTLYTRKNINQLRIDTGSFYTKTTGVFDTENGHVYKITENDIMLIQDLNQEKPFKRWR